MRRRPVFGICLFAAAASLFLIAQPPDLRACACCTDAGQRNVGVVALDSERRAEIEKIRFADEAHLFLNAAGMDAVRGIASPSEIYGLEASWRGDRLVFTLKGSDGRSGALMLQIPAKLSVFEIDPRESGTESEPTLYKEWKLTSKVESSGVFKIGAGGAQFITLILQGHGNSCTTADDFYHWTLVVEGPRDNYSLFGRLLKQD